MTGVQSLALWLYGLLWTLALPAVALRFWWRGRIEPQYRKDWRQRLGLWPDVPARGPGPRVWLHAVSLGETRAAQPLVLALRRLRPDVQWVLTTGTATGHAAGRSLLAERDLHGWLPLDTPFAVRRFLQTLQPDVGLLMETETWPQLIHAAHQAGVPLVLANARLSARSLRKGLRMAVLTRPMMARLTAVWAQSNEDAQRFRQAGVPAQLLQVMGNLKYDLQPDPALVLRGRAWVRGLKAAARPRRVVLAASWREGEDEALIDAWSQALQRRSAALAPLNALPPPLLVVVPRHPQRFDEVHALWQRAQPGWRISRRSQWPSTGPDDAALQADVWLGDSLGEMPAYYAAADVALLGGSFAPLGGQNLIEAAACGCPVWMGPHTFNFDEAARRACLGGGARQVPDLQQAVLEVLAWDEHDRLAMAGAASGLVAEHRGAAQRMAQAVLQILPT